ncbi:hypothetical protein [Streptomyces sp. NPDC008125]|uniref:hypothetical protein n=1 Tax=Streptomyces sp. NPDC008125 TaxID=3364811 RepID=UPI0036E32D71
MSYPLEPRPTAYPAPRPASPTAPATVPVTGLVQLHDEHREAVVWVPDAYGRMVPVSRSQADAMLALVPATSPRDLAPQPLLDPRAQTIVAAGLGTGAAAAGVGYGLGQVLAPLAAVASGTGLWALALLAVVGATARRTTGTTYVTHNHTDARWFGRAATTTRNGR